MFFSSVSLRCLMLPPVLLLAAARSIYGSIPGEGANHSTQLASVFPRPVPSTNAWFARAPQMQGRRQDVTLQILTDKPRYFSGEPIVVALSFSNVASSEGVLNLGAEGTEGLSITMRNTNSLEVCRWAGSRVGGYVASGRMALPAGKTKKKSFVLNRWCSTVVPVGKYTIEVTAADVGNPWLSLSSKADFRIAPAVPGGLSRLFAAEYSKSKSTPTDQHTISIQKIAYSRSSDAVHYLAWVLSSKDASIFDKLIAVEGLGRIHSVRAVAILSDVTTGRRWIARPEKENLPDVFQLLLKRFAVAAAYEMYDDVRGRKASESKILEALEPIIRSNPRPQNPPD